MLVGMQSAPPLTFTRVTNVCVVQVTRGRGRWGDGCVLCCYRNSCKIAARIAGNLHGPFAVAFTLKPPVSACMFSSRVLWHYLGELD